ncbi:MAG: hypothetical protein HY760_07915 [Nitrospirae bacterium]|nr:hypothetical protein [Nitrospirota bacterium]
MAEVKISLNVDSEAAVARINSVERHVKSAFGQITTSGNGSSSKIKSAWGETTGAIGGAWDMLKARWLGLTAAIMGATAVIGFLKDTAAAAIESERATSRLQATVGALGISYGTYSSQIQSAIDATSKYARVTDEEASDALQNMILQTGDLGLSLENLPRVMDLSRAATIGTAQAAELLAKGLTGNIELLGRQFPALRQAASALDDNASAAEKVALMTKFFNDKIAGQAGQMGPYEASVRDLTVAYDDFKEKVGGPVMDVMSQLFRMTTNVTVSTGELVGTVKNAWNFLKTGGKAKFTPEWMVPFLPPPPVVPPPPAPANIVPPAAIEATKKLKEQMKDLNLEIIQLKSGEDAYLAALEKKMIAETQNAKIVHQFIGLLREKNALEQQATVIDILPQTEVLTFNAQLQEQTDQATDRNIAQMQGFIAQHTALSGALGETAQQQAVLNQRLEQGQFFAQAAGGAVGTLIQAVTQMGIAGQFSGRMFGAAMMGFVSQTLSSLAVMAASKAIESIAWASYASGLALLGHPGAAAAVGQFTASAAFWGKVAAGAGVGAVVTGIAAGRMAAETKGKTPRQENNPPPVEKTSSPTAQPQPQMINYYFQGDLVAYDDVARKLRPYQQELARDTN